MAILTVKYSSEPKVKHWWPPQLIYQLP